MEKWHKEISEGGGKKTFKDNSNNGIKCEQENELTFLLNLN